MRVPINHTLGKDEVRSRLQARSHEIADAIPGGMAQVSTSWPNEDCMALEINAMGNVTQAQVLVEDTQVVIQIALPPALSFFEPIVASAIRKKGHKLLTEG